MTETWGVCVCVPLCGCVKCGGVYMFSNLIGCDGERVFYDGGSMISVNGQIVAEGPQFTLEEVVSISLVVFDASLLTCIDVSILSQIY